VLRFGKKNQPNQKPSKQGQTKKPHGFTLTPHASNVIPPHTDAHPFMLLLEDFVGEAMPILVSKQNLSLNTSTALRNGPSSSFTAPRRTRDSTAQTWHLPEPGSKQDRAPHTLPSPHPQPAGSPQSLRQTTC